MNKSNLQVDDAHNNSHITMKLQQRILVPIIFIILTVIVVQIRKEHAAIREITLSSSAVVVSQVTTVTAEHTAASNSTVRHSSASVHPPTQSLRHNIETQAIHPAVLSNVSVHTGTATNNNVTGGCAINMYGLARTFKDLILPSMIPNVIEPNMEHGCDYFVHYYRIDMEKKGHPVNPDEIFLLKAAVEEAAQKAKRPAPSVTFHYHTNEDVERIHAVLLAAVRANNGRNKYRINGSPLSSSINVVKMWNSQNEVWRLMEKTAKASGKTYDRVAMMRSDVVYLKPINIYMTHLHEIDHSNTHCVIPKFGKFPISDRMFYGPYEATKLWATARLPVVHEHVLKHPNGLHSERYLKRAVFPLIKALGMHIDEDGSICFMCARGDGSIEYGDCEHYLENPKLALEELFVGRTCTAGTKSRKGKMWCPIPTHSNTSSPL